MSDSLTKTKVFSVNIGPKMVVFLNQRGDNTIEILGLEIILKPCKIKKTKGTILRSSLPSK